MGDRKVGPDAEPDQVADRVSLGGRIFRVITARAKQAFWISGQAQKAGLYELRRRPGETMGDFALRLQGELSASGAAHLLLGGLLLPEHLEDKDWTPQIALETGRFVGECEGEEDLKTISHLFASFIIGFFASGMASLMSSEPSSSEAAEARDHPESNGAMTTMANGVS
jgi:hypothetical protein